MLRAAAGLVVGYLVLAGMAVILMGLAWLATGPGFAFRDGTPDTSTGWSLLSVGLGLVCAGFGGRVAARFSTHAVPLLAGVVFVLVPGGRQIDWPKLRAHLGVSRLSLPDQEEAKDVTGYERGAITPFGSARAWPVVADAAIRDLGRVAIGGGARGVNVHLAAQDLLRATGADVADVTKPDA